MGVRLPSVVTTAIGNVTLITTAETIVATTPPISTPLDSSTILLLAMVGWVGGAGVATLTWRFRRGATLAGAQVNVNGNTSASNGGPRLDSLFYLDVPPNIAGIQYSLTAQQNGATGNGTITDVSMMAFVL